MKYDYTEADLLGTERFLKAHDHVRTPMSLAVAIGTGTFTALSLMAAGPIGWVAVGQIALVSARNGALTWAAFGVVNEVEARLGAAFVRKPERKKIFSVPTSVKA